MPFNALVCDLSTAEIRVRVSLDSMVFSFFVLGVCCVGSGF